MSEKEKEILDAVAKQLPKLSETDKARALGVLEGMAIMADRIAAEGGEREAKRNAAGADSCGGQ